MKSEHEIARLEIYKGILIGLILFSLAFILFGGLFLYWSNTEQICLNFGELFK